MNMMGHEGKESWKTTEKETHKGTPKQMKVRQQ